MKHELVPIEIAQRRSSAALKAWETRRQQGWTHKGAHNSGGERAKSRKAQVDEALAVFERESRSENPDYFRIALDMKKALGPVATDRIIDQTGKVVPRAEMARVENRWADYPVDRVSAFKVLNPTIIVTFSDGEVVRCPAVSIEGKPLNLGRGLRVAIAFYQARDCRRRGLPDRPGTRFAVPEIISCVVEETGETFDASECNVRTAENRKAQDWRLQPARNGRKSK